MNFEGDTGKIPEKDRREDDATPDDAAREITDEFVDRFLLPKNTESDNDKDPKSKKKRSGKTRVRGRRNLP